MSDEIIIIDQTYKYVVEDILNGGIGFVRLMRLKEFSRRPPDRREILDTPEAKYPYRTQLAAKTIKLREGMGAFTEACNFWYCLNYEGIVPLLKVARIGEEVLGLMPSYQGNLRTLLYGGERNSIELLKALRPVITGLKACSECGIVHQAIKPKNILYCYNDQKLVLELSDWGIANVQVSLLTNSKEERCKALNDFGLTAYLAPERFDHYISDIRADIFSLGLICFEILTGCSLYEAGKSTAEQITSGQYYKRIGNLLSSSAPERAKELILRMLHPVPDKRLQDYGELLTFINSLS